jgi:nitrogen fixation NifU-like protein
LAHANHIHEGVNPLCGDRLQVYLLEENGLIKAASFEGSGCAISIASASLMIETIIGKTLKEVDELFLAFHTLLTNRDQVVYDKKLGKLVALAGVAEFPVRIKCATLCWHTTQAALKDSSQTASTE